MKRPSAGFTLVEVMVATTVLSLVLMLTVSAMRSIGGSTTRVAEVIDRNDEMRAVSLLLQDMLRGAQRGDAAEGGGGGGGTWASVYSGELEPGYFEAGRKSVAWLSAIPLAPGQSGRQYLRLRRDNEALLIDVLPYRENDELPNWSAASSEEVLVREVSEFDLRYRWEPRGDWAAGNPDDERLPVAMKLRLKVRDRYWPDLAVAFDGH
jgi:general secretion pathway protein J